MRIDAAYLDTLARKLREVEDRLSCAETMAHPTRARALMQEHARLKEVHGQIASWLDACREAEDLRALIKGDDAELRALAQQELPALEERLPVLERKALLAMLPPDPDDSRNTIMEIRAGTGGDEAALFAGDLFRMYSRYAESKGWRVEPIDVSPASLGGYKEVVFSVEGEKVYRTLRYESGGHRVQRIPVTEASGRIHTSAATVAVLPEVEDVDELDIPAEEIRLDLYRASGPGGQKVNKTESAVRLTHLPTGIVVQSQDERSQTRNKEKAMKVLYARIMDRRRSDEHAKTAEQRRLLIGSGDRSERIRTYNFPQNRVTDHRINLSLYALDRIIEGDMDPLLEPLAEQDMNLMLAELQGV